MEIDIKPTFEKAKGFDATCIESREIDALYVFRTFEGVDYTVKFDKKGLDEFQPNRTVSEVMKTWETNIDLRIKEIKKAIRTKKHPYLKKMVESETEFTYQYGTKRPKLIESDEYQDLHDSDIKSYKDSLDNLALQSGKISFIKISLK